MHIPPTMETCLSERGVHPRYAVQQFAQDIVFSLDNDPEREACSSSQYRWGKLSLSEAYVPCSPCHTASS